jgi:hypothetical protein
MENMPILLRETNNNSTGRKKSIGPIYLYFVLWHKMISRHSYHLNFGTFLRCLSCRLSVLSIKSVVAGQKNENVLNHAGT